MDIGIFIEYNNRVVQIPVNPAEFKVSTAGNNDTQEIIALGQVVIPRTKKLSSISWESFFPYEDWHPAIRTAGDFKSSDFYLQFLDEIRNDCKPCHLTVTGIGFDSDVVIESFDYYHQAGDHEDTYYSITLKRYQPYAVSVVSKVDIESQIKKMQEAIKASTSKPTTSQPVPSTQPAKTTTTKKKSSSSVNLNPTKFTIGAEVILNGRVHRDSSGMGPGASFTNRKVKINLINKKGSHPYHVTSTAGGHLGWVTEKSLSFSGVSSKKLPPLKNKTSNTFSPTLRAGNTKLALAKR